MAEPAPWDLPASRLTAAGSADFVRACLDSPDALVYFLLNVGDGDTQLLLLPADSSGQRRAIVVDVAVSRKVPGLIADLAAAGVLPPPDTPRLFPIVVATHPHDDHIGGMPEFLDRHGSQVDEYWEPGYYHPTDVYIETMVALEQRPEITWTQPTSGLTRYLGRVKLTVLAPGVALRSRFDSYGTEINDSSLALRVAFPATRVTSVRSSEGRSDRLYLRLDEPWSLLLGADSQTTAWAQATVDFPQLHRDANPVLYDELKLGTGPDPLRAQVFKVPHHASKHGLNLELVERIGPRLSLVSCSAAGRYNFPHTLAVEALREARQPVASSGRERLPDHELGIHYTCGRALDAAGQPEPLGSIALVVPPKRGATLRMWRFGDSRREAVNLQAARRLTV